jgi:hypothetical protein
MQSAPVSCRELDLIAHEALHVRNEHARATADTVRRKLHARLLDLEARFERTLAREIPDEALRTAWLRHLRARGGAPEEPSPLPIVIFRGRSEAGAEVEVRGAADDALEIAVDGAIVDRSVSRAATLPLRLDHGTWLLPVSNLGDFRETYGAAPEAVEALRAWVDQPRGEPPWAELRTLAADGLIDRTFALTPRGRRALGRAA